MIKITSDVYWDKNSIAAVKKIDDGTKHSISILPKNSSVWIEHFFTTSQNVTECWSDLMLALTMPI